MRLTPRTLAALSLALLAASPGRAAEPERWVAVTPRAFRAALEPLRAHRAAEGLATEVLIVEDLVPEASAPPAARAARLREAALAARPTYLLLAGDPRALPPFEVGDTASDRPYGDRDGDGLPEVAVGRLPARDPDELGRMVARTVGYETARTPALWRKRCALVAGEGHFGALIDTLLEQMFQRVVAAKIPAGYDVDLTYANPRSPWCYPPERFSDRVVGCLDEGALVVAYIGHGSERSVDDLTVVGPDGRGRRYPVLDVARARQVVTAAPPVFVALACLTGRFEGPERCIGEELLRTGQGPVAFYGASRESHPVQNALLGIALVGALFGDDAPARLGPAIDRAEATLLRDDGDPLRTEVLTLALPFMPREEQAREMPRHVDMYNLLGDPALRLARPAGRVALSAPEAARPGERVVVEGRAPGARGVTVTLELTRDRLRPEVPGEGPLERYARANDKVLWTELARVGPDGGFRVELRVPPDAAPGRCLVRAFSVGEGEACGIGARPLRVVER